MKKHIKYLGFIGFVFMPLGYADAGDITLPETVSIKTGSFNYRQSGEFLKQGYPVDAPMVEVHFDKPFEMMTYQVTVGDFQACIDAAVCEKPLHHGPYDAALPVTGVSYRDASLYAEWLSQNTHEHWRLPTDAEWAYAAGSRFVDDAIDVEIDRNNPAARWLVKYQKFASSGTAADAVIKPSGTFGANENGLYDLSGNIWEWTSTCYRRTSLDADGQKVSTTENCGVLVSEGRHRAYMSFFIQDAKGGGCSVGAPPDYLGFRLIKEPKMSFFEALFHRLTF